MRFRIGGSWEHLAATGVWEGQPGALEMKTSGGKFVLPTPEVAKKGRFPSPTSAGGVMTLHPYESIYSACGGYGTFLPYVVEEMSAEMHAYYDVVAELSEEAARALGVTGGEWVWLETAAGRLKLRARVAPGVHPGVVAVRVGLGHAAGAFSAGNGINPLELVEADFDRISGAVTAGTTAVKVYPAAARAKSEVTSG